MKLQVAIDRVPLERASDLVQQLNQADILEIGTSLTKDYGLECVRQTKPYQGAAKLLVDIKTMDEGAYEFRQYFAAGADILTVMGAAAYETVAICYEEAEKHGKEVMIDLLSCDAARIERIAHFDNAIYALHFSKDQHQAVDLQEEVLRFTRRFPQVKRIALAGGLDLTSVQELMATPLEIAIVGSNIINAADPVALLHQYKEVMKRG